MKDDCVEIVLGFVTKDGLVVVGGADEGLLSGGRGKDEKARRRLKTCRLLAAMR